MAGIIYSLSAIPTSPITTTQYTKPVKHQLFRDDYLDPAVVNSLTEKAELGDLNAQQQLGRYYKFLRFIAEEEDKAVKWCAMAAKQGSSSALEDLIELASPFPPPLKHMEVATSSPEGNKEAQFQLGKMFALGDGVPKDYREAVKWYRIAAERGYAPAQANLGWMCANGLGTSQNPYEAVKWYRAAAAQEITGAQCNLAKMCADGVGTDKNEVEALGLYRKAAEKGYAPAQATLGWLYALGRGGVSKDEREAIKWYQNAAKQGNVIAQYQLGYLFEFGQDVKNIEQALYWYKQAASLGNVEAEKAHIRLASQTGIAATTSVGGPTPEETAAIHMMLAKALPKLAPTVSSSLQLPADAAHRSKDIPSEPTLAAVQAKGINEVEIVDDYFNESLLDSSEVQRLRQEATTGDANLKIKLARRYQTGNGLPKNEQEVIEWFRKAGEQGHIGAQNALGIRYLQGIGGVAKDERKAAKWFKMVTDELANGLVYHPVMDGALSNLEWLYRNNADIPRDELATAKLRQAQYCLGLRYEKAQGFRTLREAIELFQKAAKGGHLEAESALKRLEAQKIAETNKVTANVLASDLGEKIPSQSERFPTLTRDRLDAVNANVTKSQLNPGITLEKESDVPPDEVPTDEQEPIEWFRMVTEQENAKAESALKREEPKKTVKPKTIKPQDEWYSSADEKAFLELKALAEAGNADAQFHLASRYYEYGKKPISKNEAEALKLYISAADQGHAEAQFNLGTIFEYGLLGPKNEGEALHWYQKAAEHTHSPVKTQAQQAVTRLTLSASTSTPRAPSPLEPATSSTDSSFDPSALIDKLINLDSVLAESTKKLQSLQEEHDILKMRSAQTSGVDLSVLQGQEKELQEVLAHQREIQQDLLERQKIANDGALSDFYLTFRLIFNDTILGCKVAHRKILGSARTTPLTSTRDTVLEVSTLLDVTTHLEEALEGIPFAIPLVKFFTVGLKGYSAVQIERAINHAAAFFTDVVECAEITEILGRKLTIFLIDAIHLIPVTPQTGWLAKGLHMLKTTKSKLVKSNINTPVKEFAEVQCEALLKEIMKGPENVKPRPTPQDIPLLIRLTTGRDIQSPSPAEMPSMTSLSINASASAALPNKPAGDPVKSSDTTTDPSALEKHLLKHDKAIRELTAFKNSFNTNVDPDENIIHPDKNGTMAQAQLRKQKAVSQGAGSGSLEIERHLHEHNARLLRLERSLGEVEESRGIFSVAPAKTESNVGDSDAAKQAFLLS